MVISQFATVKIQLNHPKIIPMAQGDPRGTWIPRSDDWGDALAAQQISRSSPVSEPAEKTSTAAASATKPEDGYPKAGMCTIF